MNNMADIRIDIPEDGELVLGYDPHDLNGIGQKYVIGRWSTEENCLVAHSGWKYSFRYWRTLEVKDNDD